MALPDQKSNLEAFTYMMGIQVGKLIYDKATEKERVLLLHAAFKFFEREDISDGELADMCIDAWKSDRQS